MNNRTPWEHLIGRKVLVRLGDNERPVDLIVKLYVNGYVMFDCGCGWYHEDGIVLEYAYG
jgi:hypothetical protein